MMAVIIWAIEPDISQKKVKPPSFGFFSFLGDLFIISEGWGKE
jgi:hypothetical protein